jgi:hypothetical protein
VGQKAVEEDRFVEAGHWLMILPGLVEAIEEQLIE